MRQWEYLVHENGKVQHKGPIKGKIAELGRDGWELVAITGIDNWVFKRPIEPEPEPEPVRGKPTLTFTLMTCEDDNVSI